MFNKKLIGLAFIITGIGLAYWGYQMSESIASQLSQAFSGTASDGVVIRYIAGVASIIIGLYLLKNK